MKINKLCKRGFCNLKDKTRVLLVGQPGGNQGWLGARPSLALPSGDGGAMPGMCQAHTLPWGSGRTTASQGPLSSHPFPSTSHLPMQAALLPSLSPGSHQSSTAAATEK